MKKLYTTLFAGAAMMMATSAFAQAPEALYMIGDGPGWTPGSPLEATSSVDGVFVFEDVNLPNATSYFSFINTVSEDWDLINDGEHRYGPAESGEAFVLNEENEVIMGGDVSWTLPQGTYTFTVDMNNMTATAVASDGTGGGDEPGDVEPGPGPEVTVPAPEQLYLIGNVTGWTETDGEEMELVEAGVFAIENVELPDAGEGYSYFAFTSELGSWADINANRVAPAEKDAEFDVEGPNPFVWGQDASWKIEAGTYNLYVNFNTGYVATTLAAGVDTIGAELNGEEVIYNLQGVRVNKANMGQGLYIINGKKVLVK